MGEASQPPQQGGSRKERTAEIFGGKIEMRRKLKIPNTLKNKESNSRCWEKDNMGWKGVI